MIKSRLVQDRCEEHRPRYITKRNDGRIANNLAEHAHIDLFCELNIFKPNISSNFLANHKALKISSFLFFHGKIFR